MHILHVVGARPSFMKAAPVFHALRMQKGVRQTLVHTRQHYDANLSSVFFSRLEMPVPDVNLAVGSGSHARQTAEVMARFEPVVLETKPDIELVYGMSIRQLRPLWSARSSESASATSKPAFVLLTAACRKKSTGWSRINLRMPYIRPQKTEISISSARGFHKTKSSVSAMS